MRPFMDLEPGLSMRPRFIFIHEKTLFIRSYPPRWRLSCRMGWARQTILDPVPRPFLLQKHATVSPGMVGFELTPRMKRETWWFRKKSTMPFKCHSYESRNPVVSSLYGFLLSQEWLTFWLSAITSNVKPRLNLTESNHSSMYLLVRSNWSFPRPEAWLIPKTSYETPHGRTVNRRTAEFRRMGSLRSVF